MGTGSQVKLLLSALFLLGGKVSDTNGGDIFRLIGQCHRLSGGPKAAHCGGPAGQEPPQESDGSFRNAYCSITGTGDMFPNKTQIQIGKPETELV